MADYITSIENWDRNFKGIDDLLLAGEKPMKITGDEIGSYCMRTISIAEEYAKAKQAEANGGAGVESKAADATPSDGEETGFSLPKSVGKLMVMYPALREPIIHGLLRRGETMNVIAAPKVGKSWFVNHLAISMAVGGYWHGHRLERGNVLIIDNELHAENSAYRIPMIGESMGLERMDYSNTLFIENFRGCGWDVMELGEYFKQFKPRDFNLVILDAFYRFMPEGFDENNNSQMMQVYNTLDLYAAMHDCAFVCIHHTSKGNQSGKGVTDVGSGAGAQSRASDTHLVLRPHAEADVVVMEAVTRSWQSPQPTCLRWEFPLWKVDDGLDPKQLKSERSHKPAAALKDSPAIELLVQRAKALLSTPKTKSRWRDELGTNTAKMNTIVEILLERKEIRDCKVANTRGEYDGFCRVE